MKPLRLRAGFTLVETVVALSLLAIAIAAMLPAMVQAMRANTESEIRTGAVAVAQQEVDNLRAQSGTWPSSGQTRAIAAGNATYQSTLSYQQYCEGAKCFTGARTVTVEVRHNGKLYYRVQTVFTSLDATGL